MSEDLIVAARCGDVPDYLGYSIVEQCTDCSYDIWLSPRTRAVRPNTPAICTHCLPARIEADPDPQFNVLPSTLQELSELLRRPPV